MAKASKPIALVKGHRTKKEKEMREKAEKELASGSAWGEWESVKNNTDAHKEFLRLKKLFKKIKKDDALHEGPINRYCLMHSECIQLASFQSMLYRAIEKSDDLDKQMDYFKELITADKKLMDKRAAMLAIEKENLMTIASVLRSIPKKVDEDKSEDPMAAFLRNRG